MERIYLDNDAQPHRWIRQLLRSLQMQCNIIFGNASAVNSWGREARSILDRSRHVMLSRSTHGLIMKLFLQVAGTESDNTAIIQTAMKRQNEGRHIITTAVEHEAVLKPMQYLETQGFEVTYLPVDQNGEISLDDLKKEITR